MTTRATRHWVTELYPSPDEDNFGVVGNFEVVRIDDYLAACRAGVELANYVIHDIESRSSVPVPQCSIYRNAVDLKTHYEEEGT